MSALKSAVAEPEDSIIEHFVGIKRRCWQLPARNLDIALVIPPVRSSLIVIIVHTCSFYWRYTRDGFVRNQQLSAIPERIAVRKRNCIVSQNRREKQFSDKRDDFFRRYTIRLFGKKVQFSVLFSLNSLNKYILCCLFPTVRSNASILPLNNV